MHTTTKKPPIPIAAERVRQEIRHLLIAYGKSAYAVKNDTPSFHHIFARSINRFIVNGKYHEQEKKIIGKYELSVDLSKEFPICSVVVSIVLLMTLSQERMIHEIISVLEKILATDIHSLCGTLQMLQEGMAITKNLDEHQSIEFSIQDSKLCCKIQEDAATLPSEVINLIMFSALSMHIVGHICKLDVGTLTFSAQKCSIPQNMFYRIREIFDHPIESRRQLFIITSNRDPYQLQVKDFQLREIE